MLELNKIYCGDCLDLMKEIPDNYIDLVVTSPPYDNLRDYKGYSFNFGGIAKELFRIVKAGGVIVWVVGDATVNGSETGTSFKQALYFKEIGFNLHDTMIYQKDGAPLNNKRYKPDFEYMFVISKGIPKTFNPLLKRKVNFGKSKTGHREKTGVLKERFSNNDNKYCVRNNIWEFKAGFNGDEPLGHPAPFPEALAHDHILSWSNEGDTVFDPLCGSGTTCKQALKLNRNYIGIDISEEYCQIARKRLEALPNTKLEQWFN